MRLKIVAFSALITFLPYMAYAARDGSGNYSLPSGNPVTSGTTISSTWANNTLSDIATALSDSLTKSGEAIVTGTQDLNGNKVILDIDADTSITADTDDRIDIEVAGADAVLVGYDATTNTDSFLKLDPGAFTSKANIAIARFLIDNTNALTVPAGTTAVAAGLRVEEPNLTATGTITRASTVYIVAAPTEGGTANYALWIDAGDLRMDDNAVFGDAATDTVTVTGDLTVSDDTTMTDALSVEGNTTLGNSAAVDTVTVNADMTTASGGDLTVQGAFTSLGIDDNADAVALTIDASEYALFGHTASVAQGAASSAAQFTTDTNDSRGIGILKYNATDSSYPALTFSKSGNAAEGSHTIVASDEGVGSIVFQGSNGTTFDNAANIRAEIDAAPGVATDMPGRLIFATSPDGSVTLTEALRIDSNQDVGIGTQATPSARLHVVDSVSGDVSKIESTEAGATAANFVLYRNSATPADSDALFEFLFTGEDDGGAETTYASIRTVISDQTNGTEDGRLQLGSMQAGTVNADAWTLDLGLYADNATGGDKGVGTINADAVYDDNAGPLTDYVLDFYVDGYVDPTNYDHDLWKQFDTADFGIDAYVAKWMERRALPCFAARTEGAKSYEQSVGQLARCLVQAAETQAVHIKELNERVKSLEERLAALEAKSAP